MKVLFCAGEASGDLYAHAIASELLSQYPEANIGGIGGTRFARVANQPLIKNSSSWEAFLLFNPFERVWVQLALTNDFDKYWPKVRQEFLSPLISVS